jgi:hypothetical protein
VTIAAWAARLGEEIGLGPLPLERTGLCEVRFEPDIDVAFELSADGALLHLHAALLPIPAEPAAELDFLATLLALNDPADDEAAAGGSALAVDPVRGEAVLCERLGAPGIRDYEGFRRAVAAFVRRVPGLRRALAGQEDVGEGAAPRSDATDPFYLHAHFLRA